MAKPRPLQNQFSGMYRDKPRNRLPPGNVWNVINMLPEIYGPLASRAGWSFASNAMSSATATSLYPRAGIYAIFSPTAGADAQNLVIDEDGFLFKVGANQSVTTIGAALPVFQNPVFHGGTSVSGTTAATAATYTGLVIIPDINGAAVPKKYNGTTISDLNGSPPKARYAIVYKDYTVLGNGSVSGASGQVEYTNRIWFSPPGDPDCGYSGAVVAWDTTDSWIDFSLPVAGFGATKGALLVFHRHQISRIRGSTPPPDEDMIVDDGWLKVGLLDSFSITEHEEYVYWCAPEGVFRTDGVTFENLAKRGGMLKYWLDLVGSATGTYKFATGIIRNYLVIAVKSAANGNFVDAFMVNLDTFSWYRMSNFNFISMWQGTGQADAGDELYAAHSNSARADSKIVALDEIFDAAIGGEKDGAYVEPFSTLETAFFELGRPGLKRIRRTFFGMRYGSLGVSNPTPEMTISTSVDADYSSDFTSTSDGGITTTITPLSSTDYHRFNVFVNRQSEGVAFKFVQAVAVDPFILHDIGAEVIFQEESKKKFTGGATYGGGGQILS